MDAAVHQPAQAKRGKPVNGAGAGSESSIVSPQTLAPNMATVSVAEGYNRWAAAYDSDPNPLLAREERYILPLLPNLRNKNVLDLACGTGRWLEKLLVLKPRTAVGVDLSAAMLSIAKGKTHAAGHLAQADGLVLPFRPDAFDFAMYSFGASHMLDIRRLARELARVLKRGADLFLTDVNADAHARGWRTGFRDKHSAAQIESCPCTAEEIIRAFYSASFECVSHVPLCLGEAERPIFERAGKLHRFADACRVPAILFCHFRRRPELKSQAC
jgi:ubiquinone/menaquinone biosynthesis C-methylase UbiE